MNSTKKVVKPFVPPIAVTVFRRLQNAFRMMDARAKLNGADKLHLASGSNILSGWANIDRGGYPGVIKFDLSHPLPIEAGSIRFIFSEHFIEHLTLEEGEVLLQGCYRFLGEGGVIRISTPNMQGIASKYMSRNVPSFTADFGWYPETPCRYINEAMSLWGHRFMYDYDELRRLLNRVGFTDVYQVNRHESAYPELRNLEFRPLRNDLIVEALK